MTVLVGEVLKEARVQRGILYSDLAKETGLSNSSISRIERGDFGLTLGTCSLLVKALGIPVNVFFEKITGKVFEVKVLSKPIENRVFPTNDDLVSFERYAEANFDLSLDKVIDHLNIILNELFKTETVRGLTQYPISTSPHEFTKSEILEYLRGTPPLRNVNLQFPILIDLEKLSRVVQEGGTIIDEDVNTYCDRIMDKVQDETSARRVIDLTEIEKVQNFNGKRKTTLIENFKLNDIFSVDALGPKNGEFFYICFQSLDFQKKWERNEKYKFSRLLILISRWKAYLNMNEPGWMSKLFL